MTKYKSGTEIRKKKANDQTVPPVFCSGRRLCSITRITSAKEIIKAPGFRELKIGNNKKDIIFRRELYQPT